MLAISVQEYVGCLLLLSAPCLCLALDSHPVLGVSSQALIYCIPSSSDYCPRCCLLSPYCPEATSAVHLLFFLVISHFLPCLSPSYYPVRHRSLPLLHSLQLGSCHITSSFCLQLLLHFLAASSFSLLTSLKTHLACKLAALMQLAFYRFP